jgi:hypothetical protein
MSNHARTVRTMFAATAAVAVLGVFATASATGAGPVVLGSRAFAPNGEGWGSARPSQIFNGGDPSGLVSHIHWTSWGGSSAIGYGLNAIFTPQGGYYRQLARIELRAHVLGRCSANGPRAYSQLLFREPSYPGGPFGSWTLWSGAHSICRFGF